VANAVDLCLAETVAGDLGITADASVQRMVTAASRAIATFCGRTFQLEELTEHPTSYGGAFVLLNRAPVVEVLSVHEFGRELAPEEFRSVGDHGTLARIGPPWRETVAEVGGIISRTVRDWEGAPSPDGITVVYRGGYVTPGQAELTPALVVTLPEDIQEAAVMVATSAYRRRGMFGDIQAESLGDWSVTYRAAQQSILAPEVQGMLAAYRVVRFA